MQPRKETLETITEIRAKMKMARWMMEELKTSPKGSLTYKHVEDLINKIETNIKELPKMEISDEQLAKLNNDHLNLALEYVKAKPKSPPNTDASPPLSSSAAILSSTTTPTQRTNMLENAVTPQEIKSTPKPLPTPNLNMEQIEVKQPLEKLSSKIVKLHNEVVKLDTKPSKDPQKTAEQKDIKKAKIKFLNDFRNQIETKFEGQIKVPVNELKAIVMSVCKTHEKILDKVFYKESQDVSETKGGILHSIKQKVAQTFGSEIGETERDLLAFLGKDGKKWLDGIREMLQPAVAEQATRLRR